jgi:hypothetical protein
MQSQAIGKNYHNLSSYSSSLLLAGLFLWIWIPILGIFPLLLSIQCSLFKSSQPSKAQSLVNNIILFIIVFTVSIFCSSYPIWNDTEVYVQDYQQLGQLTPFDFEYGKGLEFVHMLLAYPIYHLTNGSTYAFLFNHTFIINFLAVFVIAKKLSRKYYPILLIIIFSTPHYYLQMLIMRQSISNIFLMCALVFIESSPTLFYLFLSLTFFSHTSNIINILTLIVVKLIFDHPHLKKNINTNYRYILIFLVAFAMLVAYGLLTGLFPSIVNYTTQILNIIGLNQLSSYFEHRADLYELYNRDSIPISPIWLSYFILIFLAFIFSVINARRDKFIPIISAQNTAFFIIFSLQFMSYVFVIISGFAWRISYLFLSLHGFFYALAIQGSIVLKRFILGIAVTVNVAFFVRYVSQYNLYGEGHIFMNGKILEMTIFDYINFFVNSHPN